MNILFVYERKIIPTFGGLERVTYLLGRGLRGRGHSVEFLSVGRTEWNSEPAETEFRQHYLAESDFNSREFKKRYSELLSAFKADVVIFQGQSPEVMQTMKATPADVKKFAVIHYQPFRLIGKERFVKNNTPRADLRLKGKLLRELAIWAPSAYRKLYLRKCIGEYSEILTYADKFIMLSERFIPRMERYYPGVDRKKLAAINNPLTFEAPERAEFWGKENLVLFVSRMNNPQKNITGFIDVWKIFHKSHPDWKAYVVGDGEHKELAMKYAKKQKTSGLEFVGNTKEVEAYYRRARIYCMTSAYEGWGMVLTEAMAHGCVPVVYDSYEASHDIVEHGIDGLLVPPFDTKMMALEMSKMADDEQFRLKLANNGLKKIKKFSIERIINDWEALIKG